MIAAIGKYTTAFGRFWWNFLIGDTPELFVGVLVAIGVALALRHDRTADVIAVPLITVAFLFGSTYRARKRA
jgi:hypothetical protein